MATDSIATFTKPLEITNDDWSRIESKLKDVFSGVIIYRDRDGKEVRVTPPNYQLTYDKAIDDPTGPIVVWPTGEAVQLSDSIVGKGISKTVYRVLDLKKNITYAGGFENTDGIEIQTSLKGKRGIAQIHNHMIGIFKGKVQHFFYGELYDTDLSKRIDMCTLEDLKVIVKDLVYAIIALEGEDPKGIWIQHGDIKDANIFLKIDKVSQRVLDAYLGDFGVVGKQETVEKDEETVEKEMKKYGCTLHARRESQREKFMSTVFHQIKTITELSLTELCDDDPTAHKMMKEMEAKYDYILQRGYFHWVD